MLVKLKSVDPDVRILKTIYKTLATFTTYASYPALDCLSQNFVQGSKQWSKRHLGSKMTIRLNTWNDYYVYQSIMKLYLLVGLALVVGGLDEEEAGRLDDKVEGFEEDFVPPLPNFCLSWWLQISQAIRTCIAFNLPVFSRNGTLINWLNWLKGTYTKGGY